MPSSTTVHSCCPCTRSSLVALGALALLLSGCLDPLVSDQVERSDAIVPAGQSVPSVADDAVVLRRIDENDGIDGDLVELRSAFMAGEAVHYRDFGTSPTLTQPLYLLVDRADDGPFETPWGRFGPVGHPPIWNVVPGDPAYSPLWQVMLVPVSATWAGEQLPSFEAVEQARSLGLIDAAIETDVIINCPVVTPTTRMEMPDGSLAEPSVAYYQGMAVTYFDVGMIDLDDQGGALVGDAWVLQREGSEPLSEPMRGVDITGDGDRLDSNDIFSTYDGLRVHLFRRNRAVVPTDYRSIDDHADELQADYRDVGDLFDGGGAARPGRVVAAYPGEEICNCPVVTP